MASPKDDVRHVIELIAGAGVAALLTFATMVWVARATGPEQYADFSAALSAVYVFVYALSPLVTTIARFTTRLAAKDDLAAVVALRRRLVRGALIGAPIALICAGLAIVPLARALRFHSPAPIFLAFVTAALYGLLNIDRGVAQGLFRFRAYNVNTLLEAGTRALLVGLLVYRFPNATLAMSAWAVAALIAEVSIAWTVSRHSGTGSGVVPWQDFNAVLRPMTILLFSIAILQNVDLLVVKRWFAADVAGAWGAASALARGFGILFVPLFTLAGPMLTREHAEGRSVVPATLRLVAAYLAVSAVPLFILARWPEVIVSFLYGPQYALAAQIVAPLAGVTVVTYAGFMLAQALLTVADYRFVRDYALMAIVQIVALIMFHATFGEVFAALYAVQGAALVVVSLRTLSWTSSENDTR